MKKALLGLAVLSWLTVASVEAQPRPSTNPTPAPVTPTTNPVDVTPTTPPAAPVNPDAGPRFKVGQLVLDGNTVLSPEQVRGVLAAYENREVTLGELREAASKLQQLYRSQGYFLAQVVVPPQSAEDGVFKLFALEGKVGTVTVEGNDDYSTEFIKYYFRPATEKGVWNSDSLEKQLRILNEFSDLKVRSILRPGAHQGETDAVLKVEDDTPIHGGFDYNNYGSRFTGENRLGTDFFAGSLLTEGDYFFGRAVFPFPARQFKPYLQAAYSIPVTDNGDRITLQYANADTFVGQELTVLDIRGTADVYGLNFNHPLERSLQHSSDLYGGFTAKSVNNFFQGTTPLSLDEIRELTLGWSGNWLDQDGRTFFNTYLTQGLGTFLGGTPNGHPLASRLGGGDSFTKLNADGARVQRLGEGQFLLFRVGGQVTGNSLLISEQYALGGPESVRGYIQSEFLGDVGYTMSGEYRFTLYDEPDAQLQMGFFLDHGQAWLNTSQPGQLAHLSLFGGGLGWRANLFESTNLRLDLGFPISPGTNIYGRNPVIYGQMGTRF